MKIAALIVAAGKSERFSALIPKQFTLWNGQPLVIHAVKAFQAMCSPICIVLQKDIAPYWSEKIKEAFPKALICIGGLQRQDSVRYGLEALVPMNPDRVLIHDGARPFVSPKLINRVISGLNQCSSVFPGIEITDTVRDIHAQTTIDRSPLRRVQTPQGFDFQTIIALHQQYAGEVFTDDIQLCERNSIPTLCVEGDFMNLKITYPSDLPERKNIKVGQGIDTHAIESGGSLHLLGINIEEEFHFVGHSDADVGLHSITDAILGTIGDGDIGMHFPPTDMRWKGVDSSIFLKHALKLLEERGGEIQHVDVTFVGERPKISLYRELMKNKVAELMSIPLDKVSIKATTTEKLGFCGRGEGVTVFSLVTVAI